MGREEEVTAGDDVRNAAGARDPRVASRGEEQGRGRLVDAEKGRSSSRPTPNAHLRPDACASDRRAACTRLDFGGAGGAPAGTSAIVTALVDIAEGARWGVIGATDGFDSFPRAPRVPVLG